MTVGAPDVVRDYEQAGFGRRLEPGARPALVLVDLVEAYFRPGAELYMGTDSCLASAARVLTAARSAGVQVVHTKVSFAAGGVDGGAFFRKVGALRHFIGDSELGQLRPEVAPISGEVVLVNGSTSRRLTDFSADLGARPLHEMTVTADDGYPVHGWLVLPDGPGPHPVLLDIHGGPYAQFGWKPYDEAQVLAGAGYAVLLTNPRGAAGYGEQHGRAIQGAMGQRDAADLMAFLDGVLADPSYPLDAARVGVLGGSYGGYMTAWLLAHQPDRFVAGIVERGFLDPETFLGTSDIGWFFPEGYLGPVEAMAAQSPMAVVDRVVAPTLVIHSERDLRCPLEQGQRYFAALLRAGVDAELLIFPGESHGLTRGGRPRHRRQRFEHLLAWWAKHLPVTPDRPGPDVASRHVS